MTYQADCTLPSDLLEQISNQGFEFLPELIRILVNAAMQAERQKYLKAAPYQRSEGRYGHANGYKPKTVQTRLGEISFDIPQVREGGFYPEVLEKGQRSERALTLTLTLAEIYVQGVSTRKVAAVIGQLCGTFISSSQVSRAAGLLDETVTAWRNRPLGQIVYLYLDACYEKVRQDGQKRVSMAISRLKAH
jgi:putative transposase